MTKKMDWIRNRPIAHRGLHSGDEAIPENSLKAFENAINHNYPIELDVHLTADNKVVVFHDDDLKRMCGLNLKIFEVTSEELKNHFLLGSQEQIPLLEEVLNLVNSKVPILIELKPGKANKKIHVPLLKLLDNYTGEIAVQSFDPFLLRWFVKYSPELIRGQLSGSYKGEKMFFLIKSLLRNYSLNFLSKPDFIAHEANDVNYKSVQSLRTNKTPVLVWTVRSSNEWKSIINYSDNIIFENFRP